MLGTKRALLCVGVVAVMVLAACGGGMSATSGTSVTTTSEHSASAPPRTGTYTNGPGGAPHYFVDLTTDSAGTLNGSVKFRYQDGTTSTVFTFSGPWKPGSATLRALTIPQEGSAAQSSSSVPSSIPVAIGSDTLDFTGCQRYFHFVTSSAQCRFTRTSTRAGG